VVLDHVAHAVPRWQDAWRRYAVDLGATWSSGGESIGFAPAQLRFGNTARIELLMPHDTGRIDFLARFLAQHGPGPHHLTFKVPDLGDALSRARDAGYEPVGEDRSDPFWKEAFLHPKQATGIVVQLAEAPAGWDTPPPPDFPTDRRPRRDGSGPVEAASLERAVHAVADLDEATALFVGLLGGEQVDVGADPGGRWVDLSWGGPLLLRLMTPVAGPSGGEGSGLAEWIGSRRGRLHHLAFSAEEPSALVGARPLGGNGTRFEIPPEENLGLRLVLTPR
jgi:methylmalonyl-CoA/ethylmalonyl-CoA epimerase